MRQFEQGRAGYELSCFCIARPMLITLSAMKPSQTKRPPTEAAHRQILRSARVRRRRRCVTGRGACASWRANQQCPALATSSTRTILFVPLPLLSHHHSLNNSQYHVTDIYN